MNRLVDIAIAAAALAAPVALAASVRPTRLELEVLALLVLGAAALGSELWAREIARRAVGFAPLPGLVTLSWLVGVQLALVQGLIAPAPYNAERALGGFALLLLGVLTRWIAVAALGPRFLTPSADDEPLYTDGIYAQMRHPAAAAAVMIAAGASLLAGSLAGIAWALFAALPLAVGASLREDRALQARHGEAHAAYRKATPALVPRPRFL